MTIGALSARATTWLVSTLRADSGVTALVAQHTYAGNAAGVNEDVVPFPYVRVQFMSGVDVRTVNRRDRILGDYVYLVEAIINDATFAPLYPIIDAVYTALNGKVNQAVMDAHVNSCVAEEEIQRSYEDDGEQYCHLGHMYRVQVVPN